MRPRSTGPGRCRKTLHWQGTIDTAHLALDLFDGQVCRKLDDGEREALGHVEDDDACPWDLLREWEWLRGEWDDATMATIGVIRACLSADRMRNSSGDWR